MDLGLGLTNLNSFPHCSSGISENWKRFVDLGVRFTVRATLQDEKIHFSGTAVDFQRESFHAIVTEPYLGPPLPKHVHIKDAEQIIDDLKSLFQETFEGLSKIIKPNGKIIIVIPSIRTRIKNVRMDTDFIKKYGLFVENSFMDFNSRHRILREIYLIRKN